MKAIFTVAAILLAGAANGQDAGSALPLAPKGGVAQLEFAHRLYTAGMARKNALEVLAAAQLAREVVVSDVARTRITEPGAPTGSDEGGSAPASADEMLGAAERIAGNDETLLLLVDRVAGELPDGSVTAARTESVLGAGQTDIWTIPFFAGARAEAAVIGAGDATLWLGIADQDGVPVCLVNGASSTAYCDWVPATNGHYTLRVTNAGTRSNRYDLLTN